LVWRTDRQGKKLGNKTAREGEQTGWEGELVGYGKQLGSEGEQLGRENGKERRTGKYGEQRRR
jgi:hypothetical protein